MFIQPYNSDYMTFDEITGRYVLTTKAVSDHLGIDLNVLAKDNGNGVNAFLNRVSMLTYRKMHEYGFEDEQDRIIATTETGRKIIQEAMIEQCFYVKAVGDLSLSTKMEERALYASDGLECIFEKIIPEIGKSVINISMGC